MPTAPLTPVFANAAGELFTHPAGYAVLRYRAGTWPVDALATLLTRIGEVLRVNGWQRMLTDARQLAPFSTEAKEWIAANWMGPNSLRPQHLHIALLQPAEVFSRLATSQMQALAPSATQYQYFADEAAAHAFLAGLPQ